MMQETIMKLAASKYVESEGQKIIEEARALNEEEGVKPTAEDFREFKKLCDKELKKQKHKSRRHKLLFYKIATVAAVLLLLINVSIISVPAVRTVVLNFLTESTKQYTEVKISDDELKNKDYGKIDNYHLRLDKEYEITYLPTDFFIFSEDRGIGYVVREYAGKDDALISFEQADDDTSYNIDTENAVVEYIDINGNQALMSKKKENITVIIWRIGNHFITITGNGVEHNEIIKVARSVILSK